MNQHKRYPQNDRNEAPGLARHPSLLTPQKEDFLKRYEPLHDRFLRYCASRAYGLLAAEDLAQEAILAALKGYDRLKDKDKLLGYLIGTVNNIVRNYNRRQRFSAHWDEAQMARLESKIGDPSLAADIHYLHKAIDQLPAEQREALTLFAISGFRIKEIAETQSVSPGAVKTRISRARSRLREMLKDEESSMSLRQRLAIYTSILF